MYQSLVLIGRFQPFHNGHYKLVRYGLARCEILVIALGSANYSKTLHNPWPADQRKAMISACLTEDELAKIIWVELDDYWYDDATWFQQAKVTITNAVSSDSIALLAHYKDRDTSSYLHQFPDWQHCVYQTDDRTDATEIRRLMFEQKWDQLTHLVPKPVDECLSYYRQHPHCFYLLECYQKACLQRVSILEVGLVILCRDMVLMTKDHASEHHSIYSLPVTDLDDSMTISDCTNALKTIVLGDGHQSTIIKFSSIYDNPKRTFVKRTLMHAGCVTCDHEVNTLSQYEWVSFASLSPNNCQDDHYFIIRHMLNHNEERLN